VRSPRIHRNLTEVILPADHPQSATFHAAGFSAREATELMSVIFLLITASTLVAGLFLAAFVWAVKRGQFDDDRSPAVRILHDEATPLPLPGGEVNNPMTR